MAVLKDPSVFGRFSFTFEDGERLDREVTNVVIDTGDEKLDAFLSRVPEDVWCGVAEGVLDEIADEVLRDLEGHEPRPAPEGLTLW